MIKEGLGKKMAGILKEKVCIVTGSARGIGKEIALLFASEGAEVVVNDIRPGRGLKRVSTVLIFIRTISILQILQQFARM